MDILLASGNAHKRQEFTRILKGCRILLPQELGLSFQCEENGSTFIENALIKAHALFSIAPKGSVVLADDSGLCVDALGGGPGIHTARYGMVPGGKELESGERNDLLLSALKDKKDMEERKASFVCALALVSAPHREYVVEEEAEGHIAFSSYGDGGFGYDPIFLVNAAQGRHMAALSGDEKDRYSHRGRAGRIMNGLLEVLYGNENA